MKSAPNSLESRIQELHSDYTNQLPGKISRIQIAWNNICEQGWSEEHTSTISTICHGLAGSAKTFGFPHSAKAPAYWKSSSKKRNAPREPSKKPLPLKSAR